MATSERHFQNEVSSNDTDSYNRFDFHNWYYWSIWWQQYLFWSFHFTQRPSTDQPQITLPQPLPTNWQYPPYLTPPVQQYPPTQAPPAGGGGGITLQIRFSNGYETYIAPVWRRLVAELIDTFIVCVLLKWYLPILDYRVPEAVFLGADVVMKMEEDELEEIGWTMIVFFFSIILQRCAHGIMETLFTYKFGWTPGKWILGLRVLQCNTVQYTNTDPLRSIKIQPGIRMGLWQSLMRAIFKAFVSLFCPLIIFFLVLDRGRPQYDRAFRTTVVYHRYLFRPI